MEFWIALLGIAGTIYGGYLAGKRAHLQAEKQWDRQYALQREQWEREDKQRWDQIRLSKYSEFVHGVSDLKASATRLFVLKDEEPDPEWGDLRDKMLVHLQFVVDASSQVALVAGSVEIREAVRDCAASTQELAKAANEGIDIRPMQERTTHLLRNIIDLASTELDVRMPATVIVEEEAVTVARAAAEEE